MSSSSSPRPHRRWFWLLGGTALGAFAGAAVLTLPPVQGWLVERLVASQPGWQWQAQRVSVGPRQLDLDGVDFSMPGLHARSAPIVVRLSPGRLLQRELRIAHADLRQLRVQIEPAKIESSGTPFAGLLGEIAAALPVRWAIDRADVQAAIDLQDQGQSLLTGDLTLQGGGISAAQSGTFEYVLDAASALLPPGPEHRVRSQGHLRLTQNRENVLERIELEGDLELPRYGPLALPPGRLQLVIATAPTGESYDLRIELGEAATLRYQGQFDRSTQHLTGHATVEGDERLAGALRERLPDVRWSFGADSRIDVAAGTIELGVTGEATAAGWARIDPGLGAVEPLTAAWQAQVRVGDAGVTIDQARATVQGAASGFEAGLALSRPLRVDQPETTPLALAWISRLPVSWAAGYLPEGFALDGGQLSGRWSLTPADRPALLLEPTERMEISPVAISGPGLPPLPALALTAWPRLEVAADALHLRADDLTLTAAPGDQLSLEFEASHQLATGETRARGRAQGELPTLLSGPEQPLPFAVAASWEVALRGEEVQVDGLELSARRPTDGHPFVSLALENPFRLRLTSGALTGDPAQDLLRLAVNGLPLDWVARWLPGTSIGGHWAEGESLLRYQGEGTAFTWTTPLPWTFTRLSYGVGGKELFHGSARFAPEAAVTAADFNATIRLERAEDGSGNAVSGRVGLEADWALTRFALDLGLDADLPALPGSEGTFGPLRGRVEARAATVQESIGQVETLRVTLDQADGPLLRLEAMEPFLFARKPSGEVIFQTGAPLHAAVAPMPLSWLRPWLPAGLELAGSVEAGEFWLALEPQSFRLRATEPFRVTDFSLRRDGRELVQDALLEVYPGSDVTLIHQLRPEFQLVYSGMWHTSSGVLRVGAAEAAAFDLSLGFMGNDQTVLPRSIESQVRLEFDVLHRLPALLASGLPEQGRLVARLNGDLLGQAPLDFWARLDGLPPLAGAPGAAPVARPAVELAAQGKADGAGARFDFDVSARVIGAAATSDAAFRLTATPGEAVLSFDSALRSRYFDATDALAVASAFRAAAAADAPADGGVVSSVEPAAAPEAPSDSPAGPPSSPFWSLLRGRFDLELGTVRYAPYALHGLRGRLEVTEDAIRFSDLEGEMFAGRWSGGLQLGFDATQPTDVYQATGTFRIQQADTAKAVQTVFPNEFGSLDARIDLDARLRSGGGDLFVLLERAEADFTVESTGGTLRLTHPDAGTASTLLVLGGAVSFSPELRALGRLLRKFAEMPVERVRISGGRDADGNIVLNDFTIDSPQARLRGRGGVPVTAGVPLMGRPLDLALQLEARDEMAVILGRMKLLEKQKAADGFQRMVQPVKLQGEVGKPDPSPLYDLFARAVAGSKGTWGLIMRKVQAQLAKVEK